MASEHCALLSSPLQLHLSGFTAAQNIIRGKTERRKLHLGVFFVFSTWEFFFHFSSSISLSLHGEKKEKKKTEEEEEEGRRALPL